LPAHRKNRRPERRPGKLAQEAFDYRKQKDEREITDK
jgi:hypothetical protein